MSTLKFCDQICCDIANAKRIAEKRQLSPHIKLIEVCAPEIAQKAKPGQFVILTMGEKGERIPLTLFKWSKVKGTITLVFQELASPQKNSANSKRKIKF